jgi:hypothetical protein
LVQFLVVGLLLVGVTASAQHLDGDGSRERPSLQTTPDGSLLGAEVETERRPEAPFATACFQLNHESETIFYINVILSLDSYPYNITGGSISGIICDSPNWMVTGDLVGPKLLINGTHTGPNPGCADTISILGRFSPPAGYAGTYGFNGSKDDFTQTTLFLGFDRACP